MKWNKGLGNRVSFIIRIYIYIYMCVCVCVCVCVYRSYDVCCLYGCFFYHIRSHYFGSVLYHWIYGGIFCMLLFNCVNYVFLLL